MCAHQAVGYTAIYSLRTLLAAARVALIVGAIVVSPPKSMADDNPPPSWVDTGHGYVTRKADALTQWADSYFGGSEIDQEVASSRLRLRVVNDWDERQGDAVQVRLGGKLNLPEISNRLDLVFQGEDPNDSINGESDPTQSRIGFQYRLGKADDDALSRFDLTLGVGSSGLRPGAKYRYFHQVTPRDSVRFTQRLHYDLGEGAQTTSRLDLDHTLNDNQILTSFTRLSLGEESDGLEWSTSVAHISRWQRKSTSPQGFRERAAMLYAGVSGQTQPADYVSNYRLGLRYRRQTYRDYLFIELEPSYNWRIDEPGLPREGAWRVELRLEFLFQEDLRRDDRGGLP